MSAQYVNYDEFDNTLRSGLVALHDYNYEFRITLW